MAIEQVIAGFYTHTYNGVATGRTKEGVRYSFQTHAERVAQSDAYGRTLLDLIYAGADVDIECVFAIYKAGTYSVFWPWAAALGGIYSASLPISRRASDVALPWVGTSVANTPSASNPATITAALAIIAPENNLSLLYGTQARDVPVRLNCLPTESSGTGSKLILT